MKNHSLLIKLVVCCALVVCCPFLYAEGGRVLSGPQIDKIVRTNLERCAPQSGVLKSGRIDPALVIPTANAKEISADTVARTLHGMWRGRVLGDDRDVNVDYFWIFDVERNEALIIAQRTGKMSMPGPQSAKAPKFTYLMCAHKGYIPSKDTPQIHEFVKVSGSIDGAADVVQKATGLKLQKEHPTLQDLWQGLLATKYFDSPHGTAYAGGFFKPLQIENVANPVGPTSVSLRWDGEYRGGGATSLKYATGIPIRGVEYAQFVGTKASTGNYLVSSPGNGKLWKVESIYGADYDLMFDWTTLGPLCDSTVDPSCSTSGTLSIKSKQ